MLLALAKAFAESLAIGEIVDFSFGAMTGAAADNFALAARDDLANAPAETLAAIRFAGFAERIDNLVDEP